MKNKKYLVIGMAVILVVAAILVGVLVFGRGEEPQPTEPTGSTAEGTQPGDATEGTQVTEGTEPDSTDGTEPDSTDGTEPDSTDGTEPDATEGTEPDATESTEPGGAEGTQPDETEPSKTEPVETEPAETEPAETKPAETEPAETKPTETEPAETKPDSTEETYHVHDYDRYEISATCTEGAYEVLYCTTCGMEYPTLISYSLGHNWISDWVITKEPTVDAPGAKQRTCSRCGVFTEAIPALDPETGEAYESYVDPRVKVKEYRTCVGYDYEKISVADFRTWGEPLSIWVNEDGSLTVVYYQQNGTRVEVLVEVPPENYVRACDITDDGAYRVHLIGGYGSNAP